jgi:hypothetical protein
MTIRYGSSANTANTSKLRSGVSRTIQVLVVAGGGGGGSGSAANPAFIGGPGGAGGFLERTAVAITLGTAYTISIGAGGGGSARPGGIGQGADGSDSFFADIIAYGGGGGGAFYWSAGGGNSVVWNSWSGIKGGSGGGSGIVVSGTNALGGSGYLGQGNNGGNAFFTNTPSNTYRAGGGGGAGGAGEAGTSGGHGLGGIGRASLLNGVTYAAGGRASVNTAGAANTGNGGGSSGGTSGAGTSGGSGIVVVRFSPILTPTISAGLSSTVSFAANGDEIIRFTAGTGTVTFT